VKRICETWIISKSYISQLFDSVAVEADLSSLSNKFENKVKIKLLGLSADFFPRRKKNDFFFSINFNFLILLYLI